MKSLKTIILTSLVLVFSISVGSCQSGEKKTVKFKVYGNCEMCKKTIQNSLDVKGVKSANWNVDSKMIEIVYQADKVSEDQLHDYIASSGYDTEKKRGNDKAYSSLPECCQYSRK